jgi:hypothetical protein
VCCTGILPYCFSKSAAALYLALAHGGAAANSKYGRYAERLDIASLQPASSWFGSAPQAQAASYSETPALYAPLLSLE